MAQTRKTDDVIAPAIGGRLIALDAETGKPRWEARVGYPQGHYTVTLAPRIAKGKVIVGASGGGRRGASSSRSTRSGATRNSSSQ